MAKDYSVAIVTVKDIPSMTKRGRKAIVAWLRRQADEIEKEDPKIFARRFTARYIIKDAA